MADDVAADQLLNRQHDTTTPTVAVGTIGSKRLPIMRHCIWSPRVFTQDQFCCSPVIGSKTVSQT